MELNKISVEQFAGLLDKEASFKPGMNVVLGDNETGKSTMISAIFHTLTTAAKLDLRKDKDFVGRFFPAGGPGTIDATVTFNDGGKTFEVEKIWDRSGAETKVKLRELGGSRELGAEAEGRLRDLLRHSPAIYDNLIFGRQDNIDSVLDWCYKFFEDKSDPDVGSARERVSSALSAAGGLSEEKFLAFLDEEMGKLSSHWDFLRDSPEQSRSPGRWKRQVVGILAAYYDYIDAKTDYDKAVNVARRAEELNQSLAGLFASRAELEGRRDQLKKQENTIKELTFTQNALQVGRQNLNKAKNAQIQWPRAEARIQDGQALLQLQAEAENRKTYQKLSERLEKANALEREIARLNERLAQTKGLSDDFAAIRILPRKIERNHTRLTASKLCASVRVEEGYTLKLHQPDGTVQELSGLAQADVDGYVKLSIPGVAEVTVAPQGLDVESLQAEIQRDQAALDEALGRWGASSFEDLETKCQEREAQQSALIQKRQQLSIQLDGDSIFGLRTKLETIRINEAVEIPEDLGDQIAFFLQDEATLDGAISAERRTVNNFKEEYKDLRSLAARIEQLTTETENLAVREKELSEHTALSQDEFARKQDAVQEQLKSLNRRINEANQNIGALSVQDESDLLELENRRDRLRDVWEAAKKQYASYERIRADFEALRETGSDNFAAFHTHFNEYLSLIAGEGLLFESGDKLMLHSGRNRVSGPELLSEGTKKTLLLAFRLAVLEYFFPDGGGLVVLDDDLLDMDPGRRKRSAALLQKFAKRNQVIFTTCDPAIAALLGGNQISL